MEGFGGYKNGFWEVGVFVVFVKCDWWGDEDVGVFGKFWDGVSELGLIEDGIYIDG